MIAPNLKLTPELLAKIPDDTLLKADEIARDALGDAWYSFNPRPDQPERHDQQTAFYNSNTTGVAWLLGGNGAGTTTMVMLKVAKLVLGTPAPRKNTPFWVIATNYEQVMETCWVEKLHGMQFIPDEDVDWKKATWFKSSRGWPYSIPLKPRPGEQTSWVLEFKSYDQGRHAFQGRGIGGFAFIEQFPYSILTEVLRGCRMYSIPGSKFCEFTPIDPSLSVEIEEMIQNGYRPDDGGDPGRKYMPNNWEIYRANTRCAMEAGHVTEEWYEEFFGMIPEDARATRETGEFASYEGVIYKGFIPEIHLIDDDRVQFPFPNGVKHIRALDWGAGPENPFCCLWMYKNNRGQWIVYDEYYSNDQDKTTIDHLKEVADRWPWPTGSPNYGTTYADPSDPDNLRIAMKIDQYTEGEYEPFDMARARNAVNEGIEHVKFLLKPNLLTFNPDSEQEERQPRLLISRRACPNLAREMRIYRYERGSETGLNPRDAQPKPLKANDHSCDALRYGSYTHDSFTGRIIESKSRPGESNKKAVERVRPMETITRGDERQKIIPGGKR